jgi:anti-sigma regulatory factor (Ser/Thr protein kinase)
LKKYHFFFLFFFLSKSYGQEAVYPLRFHQIARDKGLYEKTNAFLFRDREGFAWISSLEGLIRYDGKRIKVYKHSDSDPFSLLDDNIQSPFFEDNRGDIWFTTVTGINCFRRNRGNFDRFLIQKSNSQPSNDYSAFCLDQDKWLWTRVGDSLYRFDIKQPENTLFLHELQAARFAIDTFSNGKIKRVVACYWDYQKGMEIIDYDEATHIKNRQAYFKTKDSNNLPAINIRQAVIENDTLIWLAGDAYLYSFNPSIPSSFKLHSPPSNDFSIINFTEVDNNRFLTSTNKPNFQFFDRKKGLFSPLFQQNLSSNESTYNFSNATNLYIDSSNILWLSSKKEGILHAQMHHFSFINPFIQNKIANLSIDQIIENKKGEVKCINYANPSQSFTLSNQKKIINNDILLPLSKSIYLKDEQLLCVSRNGSIQTYNNKSKKQILYKIDTLQFTTLISENDENLLIGSNKGLYCFNLDKQQLIAIENIRYFIGCIFFDKKFKIWVGSDNGNLYCYENTNKRYSIIKRISNLEDINGFYPSPTTSSVLWVATAKGIVKINLNTLKDTLLTEKDGLPTNYIQAILEDKQGNLWCSTNSGIFKYNPVSKASKNYTKRQGLSSDAYNRGAALLSSTGEMWFGGNNGVDVFHPDSIRDIGHAPQSAIVGLKIFDTYWKSETAIEVAEHITLKHNENTLTLELAAMEYTDPENNRFKVALVAEGDTIQWTDLGTQNYVTYPNLREGKYTFMLLTANSEGIWHTTPKTLVIDIKPPYWRTWWFLTLIALATIALVAYIVYLRLSKVIALQKIRLNLYENLHDDIGSRLTAIVLSVDMLMQKSAIKDDKLGQIGTISRNIVANMRRLVWATAPENDALSTVAQQMQTDKRVLLPTGVAFNLTMEKTLENLNIGGDKRYQMLSIFNEALTNIAKYAEATTVETRIEIRDTDLTMTITDNGKGYDPDAKRDDSAMSSGHGLRNMQRRANRIKGNLYINSKLREGTTVTLSFPMKDETIWAKFTSLFSKSHLNR